jgi:pantothenate kinase
LNVSIEVSIGQCIAQLSRPKSMIASIPFEIGVDIDKSFATKWLVDHLYRLGFSVSSDEVKLFKESAAAKKRDAIEMQEHKFTCGCCCNASLPME